MGKKGYTVVQSDVAELKRQDLAAKAAEKAQREAAAAAPPPPPPAPTKRVAAKPKPKRRWGLHRNRGAGGLSTPGGKLASVTTGTGAFDALGTENWPAPQTPPG